MSLTRRSLLAGAQNLPVVAATGCAGTVVRPGDLSRLRIMAPANPGGSWDTTARLLQRVIRSTGIALSDESTLVWALIASLFIGNIALPPLVRRTRRSRSAEPVKEKVAS